MNSDPATWSLDAELCRLSGTNSIEDAVFDLGLAKRRGAVSIRTVKDWHRGGAETHLYFFDVESGTGDITHALLKACTPSSFGLPIEEVLAQWLSRRTALANAGVSVPTLFYAGKGLIIEETIPFDLISTLKASDKRGKFLFGLGHYAGTIQKLGFASIAAFSDLRTRGGDVVAIDFGADLGAPDQNFASEADYCKLALDWLTEAGETLTLDEKSRLCQGHLSGLSGREYREIEKAPSED